MRVRQRVLRALGLAPAAALKSAYSRGFAAAQTGRLTADWVTGGTVSTHEELRAGLRRMRDRSRALARDNDYAKRFFALAVTNVVGPAGIQLQMKAREADGRLDTYANGVIWAAHQAWCRPSNCDVTGRQSLRQMLGLILVTMLRDGECFVRIVRNYKPSAHRVALQIIPAEMVDESVEREPAKGVNAIRMGVEVDGWQRPVAYHVKQGAGTHATHTRIPADEILHVYDVSFSDQVRGIPAMHTAIMRLRQLGAYEEAEVVAARLGASKAGFLTTEDGDAAALADGEGAEGELITEAAPGQISVLPPGVTFQAWDPTHPGGNFGPFVKATLRGIASGLGVSYASLASDLEGVNYSSIRAGLLEERDAWRALQALLIERVCEPVFAAWVEMAALSGALGTLPLSKRDKWTAGATWRPRGWQWVDPLKDAQAAIQSIDAGLRTRTEVLADQGRDFEDVARQLAEEAEFLASLGLKPAAAARPATATAANESAFTGDEDDSGAGHSDDIEEQA